MKKKKMEKPPSVFGKIGNHVREYYNNYNINSESTRSQFHRLFVFLPRGFTQTHTIRGQTEQTQLSVVSFNYIIVFRFHASVSAILVSYKL